MSKLYYDDPLVAAYMSREFGVTTSSEQCAKNFNWEEWAHSDSLIKIFIYENNLSIDEFYEHCGKFYIHPDSLPVFEPREGDLVCVDDTYYTVDKYDKFGGIKEYKIILRNGKPFFWQKVDGE